MTGVKRVESLNGNPVFLDAAADLVKQHLAGHTNTSKQLYLRCPGCSSLKCLSQKQYFEKIEAEL
jgi:protoporphyrin/coproporphyrin ferrochelatase